MCMESLAVLIAINTKVLFHVWRYGDLAAIACVFYFNSQVSELLLFLPRPLPLSFAFRSLHAAVPFGLSHRQDNKIDEKKKKNYFAQNNKTSRKIDWFTEEWQKHLLLHRHSHNHTDSCSLPSPRTGLTFGFILIWFDLIHCMLGLNRTSRTLCDAAMNNNSFVSFGFLASKSAWIKNISCDYVKENTLLLNMMYGHFNGTSQSQKRNTRNAASLLAVSLPHHRRSLLDCIRLFHWISPLLFIRIDLSFSMHTIISIHQLQ